MPLHPVCPVPQHVLPVQFAFVHCVLLVQGVPSPSVETHLLVLQYWPKATQLVCWAVVHAPCPLHTRALFRVDTSAHVAVVHSVSAPLYTQASEVPSR